MLRRENKFILFVLILISSCGNDEKVNNYVKDNFNSYNEIYKSIDDSIARYSDSLMPSFSTFLGETIQVDSMICLNSSRDKLFAAILKSNGIGKYGTSDAVSEFLGKRINGKWFFFPGGGTMIVPRHMYGKDETHPLSFHELSQIARKEMLEPGFIKKDGAYVVNDEWIDRKFYNNGYGNFDNHAAYDSVHWVLIMRKWKEKIDTNEYKPVRPKVNS